MSDYLSGTFFVSIKHFFRDVKIVKLQSNRPIGIWAVRGLPSAPGSARKGKLLRLPETRSHFGSSPAIPSSSCARNSIKCYYCQVSVILQPNRSIGYGRFLPFEGVGSQGVYASLCEHTHRLRLFGSLHPVKGKQVLRTLDCVSLAFASAASQR